MIFRLTAGTPEFVELTLPFLAVLLVAPIIAVDDFIAHQVSFQALPAITFEISWTTFAVQLVRSVRAIVLGVALGGQFHAIRAIPGRSVHALELPGRTLGKHGARRQIQERNVYVAGRFHGYSLR